MTHYDTLGIPESASQEEIKKAYRKLANQHHPDKGGDTTQFQKIQSAYDVLGNEQTRTQYDQERKFGSHGVKFNFHGSGIPPEMEDMLRNFGFAFGQGFSGHGDPFSNFRQPRRNKDLQIQIAISLSSTLEQQNKTISVQTTNGYRQTVNIEIPRGVKPNSTIKYSGLGDNFFESLPRGDLYIQIQVVPDQNFQVNNLDLYKTVAIDCLHAIIGHTITVTGLDSKQFEIVLPPGIQHGTKFRIVNQGLYEINQNIRGSLIIVVNLTVPTNLNSEQLAAIRNIINQ